MIKIIRTDSRNTDFRSLVAELDKDLAIRDGHEHAFFAQFNGIDAIAHVLVAYADGVAVGCGALREYSEGVVEIKRMYVAPGQRRQGIGSAILSGLETWARESGYRSCILETGRKQPEAIALYQQCGFSAIPNYGQYAGVDSSVCFERKFGQLPQ